jgi:hypothetical protein
MRALSYIACRRTNSVAALSEHRGKIPTHGTWRSVKATGLSAAYRLFIFIAEDLPAGVEREA